MPVILAQKRPNPPIAPPPPPPSPPLDADKWDFDEIEEDDDGIPQENAPSGHPTNHIGRNSTQQPGSVVNILSNAREIGARSSASLGTKIPSPPAVNISHTKEMKPALVTEDEGWGFDEANETVPTKSSTPSIVPPPPPLPTESIIPIDESDEGWDFDDAEKSADCADVDEINCTQLKVTSPAPVPPPPPPLPVVKQEVVGVEESGWDFDDVAEGEDSYTASREDVFNSYPVTYHLQNTTTNPPQQVPPPPPLPAAIPPEKEKDGGGDQWDFDDPLDDDQLDVGLSALEPVVVSNAGNVRDGEISSGPPSSGALVGVSSRIPPPPPLPIAPQHAALATEPSQVVPMIPTTAPTANDDAGILEADEGWEFEEDLALEDGDPPVVAAAADQPSAADEDKGWEFDDEIDIR